MYFPLKPLGLVCLCVRGWGSEPKRLALCGVMSVKRGVCAVHLDYNPCGSLLKFLFSGYNPQIVPVFHHLI